MLLTEAATGKVYSRGYDKEGRGILYLRPAKENTKDEDSQILNLVYHIERTIAATEKNGWEKMVIVQDFTGWTMKNAPPMSTTKKTIHILQNCYPERMHKVFMTNAPRMFSAFWKIAKPFIDPVTKEKINFCTGKNGKEIAMNTLDLEKVEPCIYGSSEREFDNEEYFSLPFDCNFDEKGV